MWIVDLNQAAANFRRAIVHADNLVSVHRHAGGGGRGRRTQETSINRAVVVITVATWQAAVQDMVLSCAAMSEPPAADPFLPAYKVIVGRVQSEVGAFSTPNAQNTRRLLQGVGFDPRQHWAWRQAGGRGQGSIAVQPSDVEARIDQWLKVRHAIAHGHEHLPAVRVLQSVRASASPLADPPLRLVDAEQCLVFFKRVVGLTGDALASHLGAAAPMWA
ncbi:hypothetical protein ATK74_3037 [Propionicimonas paludicola]|uniref:RiboL-PSP-HEPN domain-containing protein n=1 Tax=Propionicimonas paludicola TaxID=185243 RepID=A0A2A9CVK0_9ACTN|nr:hypothetical protein ATK74_0007 [Propionicimonas paludicola]PFG18447.1 hypothetical protein ATK74_3037 [Propionicimonas paludicola]